MERLRLMARTLVGTANVRGWSQAQVVQKKDGQGLGLVSLVYSGEGDLVELSQIGGSLLLSLSEKGRIEESDLSGLGKEIQVAAVTAEEKNGEIVISGVGGAEVYLWREGKLGQIFAGSSKLSQITGQLKEGDRLILLTTPTREMLAVGGMKKILEKGLTEIEDLAVLIHGQEDSSQMAVVVGEVEKEEVAVGVNLPEYKRVLALGGWKEKIGGWWERVVGKRPLLIKEEKKKWNLTIGLILLGLLVIGIGSGMVRRSRLIKETAYAQLNGDLTQKLQEAKSIADLNPERAKLLLSQGKAEIDDYLAKTSDQEYKKKAATLAEQLKTTEEEIFRKQEVTITTLTELSLINKGLAAEKMFVGDDGSLLLPDENATQIVGVNPQDKSTFTENLGELGKAKEVATYNKKMYGIVDSGIFEAVGDNKKIVIQPDELWKEVTLIDVFGGNVYLLDRGQSEIWKYPVLSDGFGTRRRWLGAGIQLDLSNVIDMKVDGDIWLLTSTGKLERYSRGVPVEFSMEGFPYVEGDKLSNPTAVFLTEDKVYVLEAGAGRVVVFEKESGKYERQYAAEELKNGKDLVVGQDKAYVLLPDKIVWFQL